MSSLVLSSLLIAFAASDVPPRWGPYGEYPCVNKSVTVGGYVSEGGVQTAILLYPKAAIANQTTLPFVAFAHGAIWTLIVYTYVRVHLSLHTVDQA